MHRTPIILAFGMFALLQIAPSGQSAEPMAREHWVGTWATALAPRVVTRTNGPARGRAGGAGATPTVQRLPNGFVDSVPQDANSPLKFENQTYRQNMKSTIGGDYLRVVFS